MLRKRKDKLSSSTIDDRVWRLQYTVHCGWGYQGMSV